MHLPGPPRHKRARQQPRPSNFRPLSSLFSTAALRPNRGAARLLATCLFSYLLFLNLTNSMAGYRCVGRPLGVARRPAPALIRLGAPAVRAEGSRCQLMRRSRHGVPAAVLLSLASLCASCGGSSSSALPPPPVADFSLSLSSNSISITQGAASPALNISINSVNGFTAAVQVALHALPTGVTSNPASPLSVAAGASTSVVFGASANAATGNFMASVQGTSGTLSHSASLSVAIQSAVNPALPRTAYARTDSALGAASDGTMFAFQSKGTIEMRAADLSLISVPTLAELQQIPGRTLVPGIALHPSGALIYQPFLTGASGSAGVEGGGGRH